MQSMETAISKKDAKANQNILKWPILTKLSVMSRLKLMLLLT